MEDDNHKLETASMAIIDAERSTCTTEAMYIVSYSPLCAYVVLGRRSLKAGYKRICASLTGFYDGTLIAEAKSDKIALESELCGLRDESLSLSLALEQLREHRQQELHLQTILEVATFRIEGITQSIYTHYELTILQRPRS